MAVNILTAGRLPLNCERRADEAGDGGCLRAGGTSGGNPSLIRCESLLAFWSLSSGGASRSRTHVRAGASAPRKSGAHLSAARAAELRRLRLLASK